MFASSLFILFISASLLLPEMKRTLIRTQSFGQPSATRSIFSPKHKHIFVNIQTSGEVITLNFLPWN